MIIKAEQTYSRETPIRLRLVAAAIKHMKVPAAMDQLRFMRKKAAETMLKVFKQAVANAKHNANISIESLTIKEIIVGEGPHYKRIQPVSRGRAHAILKRTSHVRVVLESTEIAKPVKAEKAQAVKLEDETKTDIKTESKKEEKKAVKLPSAQTANIKAPKMRQQQRLVTTRKTGEK